MCQDSADMWLTSTTELTMPRISQEVPNAKEPIKPGPRVKAIALTENLSIFALYSFMDDTGTMFC
jgi:hypothetical protein